MKKRIRGRRKEQEGRKKVEKITKGKENRETSCMEEAGAHRTLSWTLEVDPWLWQRPDEYCNTNQC
jgi:hypothetical protein